MTKGGRLLIVAALAFAAAQLAMTHQRHQNRVLMAERDNLRAEYRALLDENRNLKLEAQTLFNPMDLPQTARQLGMREPSVADGTLVFWAR
ncbi:MAG: cell division protein FtsL [Gammaproteobacteria bacterium]